METFPSLTELQQSRTVQQQLRDTLAFLKDITASEARRAALAARIAIITQRIRDIDLVIGEPESYAASNASSGQSRGAYLC